MAFTDITRVFYYGKIKIDYKDKAHRYYARPRINFDLDENNPKAWGKIMRPKGVTTIIDGTLEKKGLMQWPKGLALRELFGFYDFTNDQGELMQGFSEGVGTFWKENAIMGITPERAFPLIKSAADAWQRKQKKGADIGSVVHDAIEHFIKGTDFDIPEAYNWAIKEAYPIPAPGEDDPDEAARNLALKEAPVDIEMANQAFLQFQKWWLTVQPELHGSEDILYSMEHNISGTYDIDMSIPIEHHPRPDLFPGKKMIRCTTDAKTSNASKSKEAASPEGVYYSYFIQDALYELMRRELGYEPADDLCVISARKDGEFSIIFASEMGLTVEDCLDWARAVILCHKLATKTKEGLLKHPEPKINQEKEAF